LLSSALKETKIKNFINMSNLLKLIAPKLGVEKEILFAKRLEEISQSSNLENDFLKILLDFDLVVVFDNKISLEELVFKLRKLIIKNHIEIDAIGDDDFNEFDVTDHQLNIAGAIFKKKGWLVIDFCSDPNIYYLAVVPAKTRDELVKDIKSKNLFIQIFE
jgi:hypothetical protein